MHPVVHSAFQIEVFGDYIKGLIRRTNLNTSFDQLSF